VLLALRSAQEHRDYSANRPRWCPAYRERAALRWCRGASRPVNKTAFARCKFSRKNRS